MQPSQYYVYMILINVDIYIDQCYKFTADTDYRDVLLRLQKPEMLTNNTHSGTLTLSEVARRLRLVNLSPVGNEDDIINSTSKTTRRAAVLVCIFQGDGGDLRVILTQRSSMLSTHPGDVALPGGKMEDDDKDEVATALREAKEEIGLDPLLVDVVCTLESFTMKNGMVVVPVIGLLYNKAAFHPTPNIAEVEAIFDAPLDVFLKDENRREVEKEWIGEKYMLHYFDYKFEDKIYVIFALTAGILIQTASMVFQQPPAFSVMEPKFWNKISSSSSSSGSGNGNGNGNGNSNSNSNSSNL